MQLKNVFLWNVFAFTLLCPCSTRNQDWLKYADFSKLPRACSLESCRDFRLHCECSETCSKYGTCCIDSLYANLSFAKSFGRREQCSRIPGTPEEGAFMITACNPKWRRRPMIRTLCEYTSPTGEDPLSMIPVSNPVSKLTYKNYFCSLCNFDQRDAVFWDIELGFDDRVPREVTTEKRESILRRLDYSAERNGWGIWGASNNGIMEFIPVYISAKAPQTLLSMLKTCDSSVESRCAPTWTNETVQRICQSYISHLWMVRDEILVRFRNPHCAICNDLTNFEAADCYGHGTDGGASIVFSLRVDVNPSDGDKVGEINPCSKNEVFDPFYRICRALVDKNEACGRGWSIALGLWDSTSARPLFCHISPLLFFYLPLALSVLHIYLPVTSSFVS